MKLFDRFEIRRIQKPPVDVPAQLAADMRTQQGKKDIVKTMLTSGSVFDKNRLSRIMADALSTQYFRRSFYRECLTGDTKIALLDGRDVPIASLVEEQKQGKVNYVYSVDTVGRRIVRCKILDVWKKSEQKQVIKVTLDNGKIIKCTSDHLFMLRNGSYKAAGELVEGDALMPLYRRVENVYRKGYWILFDPFTNKDRVQYRYFNKVPKFYDVHHNFVHFKESVLNKLDDTPENNVVLSGEDHDRLHIKFANESSRRPEVRAKAAKTYQEKLMAMSYEDRVAWVKKARGTDRPEIEAKRCANLRKKWSDPAFQSRMFKAMYEGRVKAHTNNHKVASVELFGVADVYDMAVAEFHNFALTEGVFVHNCEMCSSHTLVSAALDLYIDQVTGVSPVTNRAVWITSDDKKLENSLTQFLDELAVEEKLRDWASTLGMFGDLFIEAIAREGVGVAYVDDSMHPADFERIDINGRLEGFVRTGLFSSQTQQTADLEAPWKYVHFRTFGATRRTLNTALGIFGETGRTFSLERDRMTDRQFRVTTKYGTSLLTPAVPIYKRLKMCEDSLIMARMTRGILWYLYKIKIAGGNLDSMAEIVANYAEYLKRSSGLNVDENSQEWKDKWSALYAQIEDLFIPESDDVTVTVEKLGGEADIKAIVDIDMLQNQLLGALRVSRSMLGICLRGDTKIRLLDGRHVTIKEIADNKALYIGKGIYACNREGNVVPRRIVNAGMTRPQTQFVRVHLDNEQYVDTTPDHPFMMRDGSFKEAQNLVQGDGLMPLYVRTEQLEFKSEANKYEKFYNPGTGEWLWTHRMVVRHKYGLEKMPLDKTPLGMVTHHRDFNPLNNDFDNLQYVKMYEHIKFHAELTRKRNKENNPMWNSEWKAKASAARKLVGRGAHKAGCLCSVCKVGRGEGGYLRKGKLPWNAGIDEKHPDFNRWRESISNGRKVAKVLNHKVIRVEKLDVVEDAYDIQIEEGYGADGGREHCFALAAGVFCHNTDELPGALGEGAARRISINFAKNAQRLQVGLRNGIKRLCQIHAAYRSLPCDPTRFEVNFAEINSAEEEELKDSLDKGVDIAGKIADFLVAHIGENELDRMEMLDYINQKFLKLPDLNFNELVKKVEGKTKNKMYPRKSIPINSDLLAYLPGNRIHRITEGMEVKEEAKIWTPSKITFTNGKG